MEKTLVLIKPDAVQRNLIGKIILRFEEKGYKIIALKFLWMDKTKAEELYLPHKGKNFYEPLIKYMTGGPILAMVLEGYKVIETVRLMMGETNPLNAAPGSIREVFAQNIERNVIHGSDSIQSAQREIPVFFKEEEIVNYQKIEETWL